MSSKHTNRSDVAWQSFSLWLLVVVSTLFSILVATLYWMGVVSSSSTLLIVGRDIIDAILPSSQVPTDRSLHLTDVLPTGYTFQFVTCEQHDNQHRQEVDAPILYDVKSKNPDDSFVALIEVCDLYKQKYGSATWCHYYFVAAAEWVHFVGEFAFQQETTDYCAVCDQCPLHAEPYYVDEWAICHLGWWNDVDDCETLCDGQGYPTGQNNAAGWTEQDVEAFDYNGRDVEEIGHCLTIDAEVGRYLSQICVDRPRINYNDLRNRECHYPKAFDWAIYLNERISSCEEPGYPIWWELENLMDGQSFLICDDSDEDDPEKRGMFGNRPSACADFLKIIQEGTGPIQNIPPEGNDMGIGGETPENLPASTTVEADPSELLPPLSSAAQLGQQDNTLSSFKLLVTAFVGGVIVTTVLFYANKVAAASPVPATIDEPHQFRVLELTEVS